jgi:hypothetical protein
MTAPPIVLVHGLWLTPRSWEGWKERFESTACWRLHGRGCGER